ncbi:hypothetical protein [Shivajiella indica]|uniref:Outer membrane protein beta-barrel domain-containing protein n=1 Tax=Shivajiella indica TaxID=872115 RepID=A0ABW5B3U1_9BACT
MKKIIIVVFILIFSHSVKAQYKGQWRAIHAYEMTSGKGFFGMTLEGEYFPLNYFSLTSAVSFYIPATGNARGFDINARYYLTEKARQWYALLGYGHYTRIYEFNPKGSVKYDSINLGVGGMIKLIDEIGLNPEVRYQPIGRDEFIFKLGVVYFIN